VLLEAQGGALTANMRPGTIVVDMSSADPVGTRKLAQDLAGRNVMLVDAPVSGGVPRAIDGTLAIMIGSNDAKAAADARPVLSRMGQRLFDVGGSGCGHAMKALNNFLSGTSYAAASEAVLVGRHFGLDPAIMTDIFNVSTGRSFATDMLLKQHLISGAYGTGFAVGLMAKDTAIAASLAEQIGLDAPLGKMIRDLWASARDAIGPEKDHTRAAIPWEQRAKRKA
jgi:3-hydroxyisobutyrate dehydrogenase